MLLPFHISIHGKTANFRSRVALQPFVIIESTTEAVILCAIVEVRNGDAII